MKWYFALSVTAALLALSRPARADIITADENGNATLSQNNGVLLETFTFTIGQDPGPGGLANALIYHSNFLANTGGIPVGDVLVTEGVGGLLSEVIRFNRVSQGGVDMIIYSATPGTDLADVGFPSQFYSNQVTVAEINGQITYTATGSQPGEFFDRAGLPATYQITSAEQATAVPEPSSIIIVCGVGGLGLAGYKWRRRRST